MGHASRDNPLTYIGPCARHFRPTLEVQSVAQYGSYSSAASIVIGLQYSMQPPNKQDFGRKVNQAWPYDGAMM